MKVTLRRATAADVLDYVRIEKAVESKINLVMTNPEEVEREVRNSIAYMIHGEDGHIVGLIAYKRKKPSQAYISEIAVLPAFQRQGIGDEALRLIMEELKNVPRIELMTHPANPARRLYERHGFKVCGRIDNFQGSSEPRLVMARILKAA